MVALKCFMSVSEVNALKPEFPVLTSQETYYINVTERNRLMLCGETVAVYCKNRTEHTDTIRTLQETGNIV
jgi:hypothetical protein